MSLPLQVRAKFPYLRPLEWPGKKVEEISAIKGRNGLVYVTIKTGDGEALGYYPKP